MTDVAYPGAASSSYRSFTCDSRSALAMTLTDDSAMAAAATMGDSSQPNHG